LTEEKITFLTEVELPPHCFMSEAVEWIAFGRVPQMQHQVDDKTDEVVDYRFWWQAMPDNFEPSFEYPWFDRLEFESLGIPVPEEYFKAAEKCLFEDVSSLPSRITEYEIKDKTLIEQDDGSVLDIYGSLAEDYRKKLATLGPLQAFVDEVEALFLPHQEVACAKLFQLLALGKIRSQAIQRKRWERLAEDGEYEAAAKFESVPPNAYTLAHDWVKDEIVFQGNKHVALRVNTQDILDYRSTLLQTGVVLSVERFGAFYVSSGAVRTNRKARRGRRYVVDWSLIKSHLSEITLRGDLPDGKESCIYELICHIPDGSTAVS